MSSVAETADYDPRHKHQQTIAAAKAAYVSSDVDYTLVDLERDIARILNRGKWPDADIVYNGTPAPPTDNNPDRNRALFQQEVDDGE